MGESTYRYRIKRESRKLFVARRNYLQARGTRDEEPADPSLCHVLEATISPRRRARGVGWRQFPWVTLVLGSGCLDLPDAAQLDPESLAIEVGNLVPRRLAAGLEIETGPPDESLASAYALSLIRERTGIGQTTTPRPETATAIPDDEPSADGSDFGFPAEADASGPEDSASAGHVPPVHPVAAELVLIAAKLSRFYFLASARSMRPLSRWNNEEASLDLDDETAGFSDGLGDLKGELVDPLLTQIQDTYNTLVQYADPQQADPPGPKLDEDPRVIRAVTQLLTEVNHWLAAAAPDVARPTLSRYHLKMFTDVAWHFLVTGRAVYPGWSDLLVDLMLNENLTGGLNDFRRARPRPVDLSDLEDAVRALLEGATIASWRRGRPGGESPRDAFYARAAEVLWAQADAVARVDEKNINSPGKKDTELPPASAFVTSFDLELEMALWRLGRPFCVAMPVHLLPKPPEPVDEEDEQADDDAPEQVDAEPCWLLATITPSDDGKLEGLSELELDQRLDQELRRPSSWQLLSPRTDKDQIRGRPVVVHISGAPLLHLPSLAASNDAVGAVRTSLGDRADHLVLRHAVTIDEYLALRQAEAELFWSSSDSDSNSSRALPDSLTKDGNANRRFWMAIGVPLADPAVRHRVVSQISLKAMLAAAAASSPTSGAGDASAVTGYVSKRANDGHDRSGINGVAINRRVDDDEASLLYWIGLDVVETDCRNFTNDLHHYACHVRAEGADKRPDPTKACTLVEENVDQ